MFIDSARFSVTSGKGGQGCAAFRREKFVVKGDDKHGEQEEIRQVYFHRKGMILVKNLLYAAK